MSKEKEFVKRALEVTKALSISKGFKKVSMDDIAAQIKCSKSKLYQYFKYKAELFTLALEDDLTKLYTELTEFFSKYGNPIVLKEFVEQRILLSRQFPFLHAYQQQNRLLDKWFNAITEETLALEHSLLLKLWFEKDSLNNEYAIINSNISEPMRIVQDIHHGQIAKFGYPIS